MSRGKKGMSKVSAVLVTLAIVFIGIMGFQMMKDSYKILPINDKQPANLTKFDFQNWHEFSAPSKTFKVLLPALPQRATENVDDPKTQEKRKYDMYVAQQDNGTIFMISLITFPNLESREEGYEILKQIMNDMIASNPSNKLNMMEEGDYKGYPTIDFSIENGELTIDAKTFIINETLYVLTRIGKSKDYTRDEFLFFINSFELIPSSETSAPLQAK
jgi:hypothetical protein